MLFILVQLGLIWGPIDWATPMWCLFGYFGTSGILFYAHLTQVFPSALAGRVITGLNVFAFGGAFLAQWGMGEVIELSPSAVAGSYLQSGYQMAFGTIFVLQIVALLLVFALKDRPRQFTSDSVDNLQRTDDGAKFLLVSGALLLAGAAALALF